MDQAQGLREAMRAAGVQTPELHPKLDKAKLWDDFKALLAQEASRLGATPLPDGHISDEVVIAAIDAQATLDRMEQAETFARVRLEMGGRQ